MCAQRGGDGMAALASMQRGDKQDVVTTLDLVGLLPLQLPVGIVD